MIKLKIEKKMRNKEKEFELEAELQIQEKKITALYGPSGSGKTTLLRCISGLSIPDKGLIQHNGKSWFDDKKNINIIPQERKIGYLFQDYALFPHMTVSQNIEYAMHPKKNKGKIKEILQKLNLNELSNRYPYQLSGGQKQRTALGRVLAMETHILFLDEPFSSLDFELKTLLLAEIKRIQIEHELTVIIISHDLYEIFQLADYVFCLENGKIINQGAPSLCFLTNSLENHFEVTGRIMHIEKSDLMIFITILVGNKIHNIMSSPDSQNKLRIGDRVCLQLKAFQPLIISMEKGGVS